MSKGVMNLGSTQKVKELCPMQPQRREGAISIMMEYQKTMAQKKKAAY
jgi:hypothetical protein